MPREIFGDVTRPSVDIGSRTRYTVPVSLLSHAVVVLSLVAAAMMAPVALPALSSGSIPSIVDLVDPPPPPPLPVRRDAPMRPANPEAAPMTAPSQIVPEREIDAGFESREAAVTVGTVVGAIDHGLPDVAPALPAVPQPVRVGGQVRAPRKLRDVPPAYPAIAQAARVQGLVILEATIGADGRVTDARVLRSIPLLDQAALDAVRQWEYMPTLLNGMPVPVVMTVTVSFVLR